MNCPQPDCDGELIVTLAADFAITPDLSLRMQSLSGMESTLVVCDTCWRDVDPTVRANIDMIVLADIDEIQQAMKGAVNGT